MVRQYRASSWYDTLLTIWLTPGRRRNFGVMRIQPIVRFLSAYSQLGVKHCPIARSEPEFNLGGGNEVQSPWSRGNRDCHVHDPCICTSFFRDVRCRQEDDS